MTGFTFDTGALIAMERKKLAFMQRLKRMQEARAVITVPAVVIAEWWRGGSHATNFNMINAFRVEPTGWSLAKLAGEAIANVENASAIDAIVMASAAYRGDTVYTGDLEDLERLREGFFQGVRVLRV